jgi:hypothetical protein
MKHGPTPIPEATSKEMPGGLIAHPRLLGAFRLRAQLECQKVAQTGCRAARIAGHWDLRRFRPTLIRLLALFFRRALRSTSAADGGSESAPTPVPTHPRRAAGNRRPVYRIACPPSPLVFAKPFAIFTCKQQGQRKTVARFSAPGYRVQARQFADSATRPIARRSFPFTSNAPRFSARVCLRRLSIAAPLVATAASSTGWRRESAAGLQPLLAGLLTAPDYSLMNIGNYVRGSLDGDSFSGQTMDGPPGAKRSARAGLRLADPFPGRDLLRFRFRPLIRHSVG